MKKAGWAALTAAALAGCAQILGVDQDYKPPGPDGDGGKAPAAVPATEIVSAGGTAASKKYRVVFAFGQPTLNQGTSASSRYRAQSGVVGATEGSR
jgi:hypothetical protein